MKQIFIYLLKYAILYNKFDESPITRVILSLNEESAKMGLKFASYTF